MSPKRRNDLATELGMLGFLRLRPMHGYEIHQLLADPAGLNGLWRLKLSHLYAILARLESEGLLQAETQAQGDRPPRKVFWLTPAGEEALVSWVTSPVTTPRDLRLVFMLKLFFARQESTDTARRLVEEQLKVCETWLGGPLVSAEHDENPQSRAVHRFRRGQIDASVEWLYWLKTELEANKQ